MITPQRLRALSLRLGALALLSFAGFGTAAVAQPRIQIVGGDSVNFGRIATDSLRHQIVIKNVGNQPLKITQVRPGCGCTTATPLDKNELAPNETATVSIAINVKGHQGIQMKNVYVTSNDPVRDTVTINYKADVIQDVTASAGIFSMVSNAKVGGDYPSTLTLTNTGDEPITIQPPTSLTPGGGEHLTVRFDLKEPKTIKPGEQLELVAHVKPDRPGMYTTEVGVQTSGKFTPSLTFRLITHAVPAEAAAPQGDAKQ